jgi:ketosteroid isomerase-like protein
MNRLWIMLPLWALAFAVPGFAQESSEAELNRLEDLRYEAMKNVDASTLDQIFAEEFVYQTLQGITHTKASYIKAVTSGDTKINSYQRSNSRVRFYGDNAVVMAHAQLNVSFKGEPRDVSLFYTNVWVKRDGRWQLVARQSTALPKQ